MTWLMVSFGVGGLACGGSGSSDASTGDDQNVTGAACAPITTLTCAPGYVSTTDGCASPRFVGAPTYGRCVADPNAGACAPINTLTCAPGFVSTTQGCASPRFVGAPTYGRCVASAGPTVVGSWTNQPGDADDLLYYTFTFNADGTYGATGGCRPNPSGPSCNAITHAAGTWSVTKSGPQLGAPGGADEIVLVDQFSQSSTYFFSIAGKKLSLATVYRGKESIFTQQ